MVTNNYAISEREEYFVSGTRFDDGVGCLPAGVGCSVRRHPHKGTLVPNGEVVSHQLSRIDSCYVCSKGSLSEQGQLPYPPEARQPDDSVIYKSHGRDSFPQLNSLATQLWAWCLERGITLSAEHLPGVENCVADFESRTI